MASIQSTLIPTMRRYRLCRANCHASARWPGGISRRCWIELIRERVIPTIGVLHIEACVVHLRKRLHHETRVAEPIVILVIVGSERKHILMPPHLHITPSLEVIRHYLRGIK